MNSARLRERSIQLIISKKRMKLDLPEPLAPISTAAFGISDMAKSARDLKPRIVTDSILVGFIKCGPSHYPSNTTPIIFCVGRGSPRHSQGHGVKLRLTDGPDVRPTAVTVAVPRPE